MTSATAICVGVDCAGMLLGILWSIWSRRTFAKRCCGELAAMGVFGIILALVASLTMLLVVRDRFAVVRVLCHVLFCVMAPLGCWRGVGMASRGKGLGPRLVGGVAILLALGGEAVYVFARRVEPFRLQVAHEQVHSPRLAGLAHPIRIVAVADVQTEGIGAYEQEVGRRIDAEHADLLVFLGDYIQRGAGERERYAAEIVRFRDWVAGLQHVPRLGVFAVDGDCEWATEVLHGVAHTLVDATVALPTEVPMQIVGLGLPISHRPLRIDQVRALTSYPGFSLVVGHAPDFMIAALTGELQPEALLLAGHCHGGQIIVPGYGPLITLSSVPRGLARGELWHRGATWMRVSRGIGVERGNAPPLRLFCPPEIVVLDLSGP